MLQHNGELLSDVLNVTEKDQVFEFHGIYGRPIPALLCDFSAPVKLDYDYTTEQLLGLLKFADNQFARWDAAQMLFTQELRRNVAHFQQGEAFDISPDVFDCTCACIGKLRTRYRISYINSNLAKRH